MGASVGTGDGESVNVELNVVPFIDLMSCLTAFLLVTAVWSQYSQINIKPKGTGRDGTKEKEVDEKIKISILLTQNKIWLGLTSGEVTIIDNIGGQYNWAELGTKLKEYREMPAFTDRGDIQIAAEDDVIYQSVMWAMDYSIESKFGDIGYVDPTSLAVRFKE